MRILEGKFASAKVFTDCIEETAEQQIRRLLDQPWIEGSHPRFMPDIHAGKGSVIGTTLLVTDKICPNLVGVDIGCGMLTIELGQMDLDYKLVDRAVREMIPSGFKVHERSQVSRAEVLEHGIDLRRLSSFGVPVDRDYAMRSLGTLGEAPFAYKDADEIIDHIQDSLRIEQHIRPVYNYKAS